MLLVRIKKSLKSELLWLSVFGLGALIVAFYPLYYFVSLTFRGVVFPLIHNHSLDYFYYLHFMKQAYDGRWLFITRYTPEVFSERFVYPVYIILGRMAKVFSIELPLAYNLSRFFLAVVMILLIFVLIRTFFPTKKEKTIRILASFTTLFGAGFVLIGKTAGATTFTRFINTWNEVNPTDRLAYIPHHLVAKIMMVASFILLYKSIFQGKKSLLILSGTCAFLGGLASPFVMINFEIILAVGFLIYLPFIAKNTGLLKQISLQTAIVAISAALPLIYYRLLEYSGFPWSSYQSWETLFVPISPFDLFMNYGPNLILSLPVIIYILIKRRRFIDFLLIAWIVEPWLGVFFLSPYIPIINVRFLSASYFIPLGVLAAQGLFLTADFFRKFIRVNKAFLLSPLIILLICLYAIDTWSNFKEQQQTLSPRFFNQYLPVDVIDGFNYLDHNTPYESVVLAGHYFSPIVPAFTHNKGVTGYQTNTWDFVGKSDELTKYFSFHNPQFADKFFQKYHIQYVFYAQDVGKPPEEFVRKMKMNLIYRNASVAIYKTAI